MVSTLHPIPARSAARPTLRRAGARVPARHCFGVTLIELLVTMAIGAILLAIGIPMMQSFIATNTLATTANELIASLNVAKSEAIRCGGGVVHFNLTAGTGSAASWNVSVDAGGATTCNTGANPITLRSGALNSSQLSVYGSTAQLNFDSLGRLPAAARLLVCSGGAASNPTPSTSRGIVVTGAGLIRLAAFNASGLPVDDSGTAFGTPCSAP